VLPSRRESSEAPGWAMLSTLPRSLCRGGAGSVTQTKAGTAPGQQLKDRTQWQSLTAPHPSPLLFSPLQRAEWKHPLYPQHPRNSMATFSSSLTLEATDTNHRFQAHTPLPKSRPQAPSLCEKFRSFHSCSFKAQSHPSRPFHHPQSAPP